MKPHHEGYDGNGQPMGKDPRTMGVSDLNALGHHKAPLLKVIRANCLECVGSRSEVRRCAAFKCAFWPYRMGTNPFYGHDGSLRSDEADFEPNEIRDPLN